MANTAPLGYNWKPLGWRDGEAVPRITLPDGTLAEAMAALGYGWDSSGSVWRKMLVDASGNQVVTLGGTSTVTANQGTAAAQANRWPVFVSDGTAERVGQKTMANSLPVTVASDQSAVPVSGTVTANQGTANTAANAWPAKVTDGTNVGAVKAASTAAVAADPAQVVAISPNNTVAVTESGTWTVQPGNTQNTTAWLVSQIASRLDASNLCVTATGAAAAAVTLSLPAVASQFHYITEIQIVKFATALLTAGTTPVLVTTTNLPGGPVFSFTAAASAQGTSEVQQIAATTPIKSSVVNTATTIVCPATTATIWRVNVWYYAAT